MTTRRTATQWQQLLSARASFSGTNIEFCEQHNISITSFYKQQAIVRQQTSANFIQVTTTTEQAQRVSCRDNQPIKFDLHSSALEFPSTMPTSQVIAIIRGLVG